MSWDSYRDSLTQTGFVDKAAVCGIDDGGVWTRSPDFNIGPNEIKSIINAFRNPESVRSTGILIGGVKYLYLQSDDSQIQGKKGSAGISIARSNKYLCSTCRKFNSCSFKSTENIHSKSETEYEGFSCVDYMTFCYGQATHCVFIGARD